jgi:glycosyltransferase involved in cell wall biosynthesis
MRVFMLVQSDRIRGPVPKLTPLLIAELRALGCTVVTHPWGRRSDRETVPTKVWRTLQDVVSVRRSARGVDFDVVVVTTAHDWRAIARDIAVALVLRPRGRPVVLQLHGSGAARLVRPGSTAFKVATRVLLTLTHGVLVLSSEEQRSFLKFRPKTHVFVVRNPYERKRFPAREPGGSGDVPQLLYVGRLLREKGIFDLVEAMPSVLERTRCRLVVVGDGELEQALHDRVSELGLTGSVTMTGYLQGDELLRAYASADVFVLPTSWDEGFPTVLAEAMDAGLPVVTTPIRGAFDYLVEGEHVLFVDPGDRSGLVSALVEAISNPALRARIGSANRERIHLFDPPVVAREYLQVLRHLAPDSDSTIVRGDGGS